MNIAAQLARLAEMALRVVVTEATGVPVPVRNRSTAGLCLASVGAPEHSDVALAMIR